MSILGLLHFSTDPLAVDEGLDEAVILLDQVIQIFDLPEFDSHRKFSGGFEISNGLGISRILIDVDHSRGCNRGLRSLFFDRMGLSI